MIGNVIRVDNATLNFDKLMFARVLVDIKINSVYPDEIPFIDENDNLCTQPLIYDWKSVTCQSCNQLGHTKEQCRHVVPTPLAQPVLPDPIVLESTSERFQAVRSRLRKIAPALVQPPRSKEDPDFEQHPDGFVIMRKDATGLVPDVTMIMTSNGFQVLGVFEGETEHDNYTVLGALPHRSND